MSVPPSLARDYLMSTPAFPFRRSRVTLGRWAGVDLSCGALAELGLR
jgi:hypothetical protein